MSQLTEHNASDTAEQIAAEGRGVWWRLPLLLAIVLVAIVFARWANQQSGETKRRDQQPPSRAAVEGKSVSLTVDFGDGRKREIESVAWFPDMTVDDLMKAASQRPDGFTYTVNGNGQMTMLASIGGVENQTGGGRFWLYRVNGKLADRGLAVYQLEPGDRVLWTFGDKE